MPRLDLSETIAAIASPSGPAARGIVRLSGRDAPEIARRHFENLGDPFPPSRPSRRVGLLQVAALKSPLRVALVLWPGSKSYTGQPLAEIHTVGSAPILEAVLADALRRGARPAEPGEFTLRAFLSGRLDLTQAEAVLGVIQARRPSQLREALSQLAGGIAGPIGTLRHRLLDVLAHLEANLDFAHESDVNPLASERLAREFEDAEREVRKLANHLQGRDRADSRFRVVLAGRPNAGKSSLFNALVGEDRAIVSHRAGTTRDYLRAPISCDGLVVDLIDTAGWETPGSEIVAQAQAFRNDQIAASDLVLLCYPALEHPGDRRGFPTEVPVLEVATKTDLVKEAQPTLGISLPSGTGLKALREAIARSLREASAETSSIAGTSARCRDRLTRAGDALLSAAEALRLDLGDEVIAIDLREALDELGLVVGEVVTEEILDRIFGQFCIGK